MKKRNTVIFDLDGTLLNTLSDLTDSVNHVLSLHRFPSRTLQEVQSSLGNGVGYLIEHVLPEGKHNPLYETCIEEFESHYAKHMQNRTVPFDGILELLKNLSDNGYKLAIVSNKFDDAVKGLCKHFFSDYIQIAIGESKQIARKPAPDTVLKAIKELRSTREDAVYVGDSEVDIRTAANAEIPCISVTWGFRKKEFLKENGADCFAEEPADLWRLLS